MNFILREGSGGTLIVSERLQGYYCGLYITSCTMLYLAVRSPSSVITARRSQISLFMELQLNILQSGFESLPWKFKLLLGVCAEKSFRCLVVEWPPGSCRLSANEVTLLGQQWGFPLRCVWGAEETDGIL